MLALKIKILEVLCVESKLDYIQLYERCVSKDMLRNKYLRSGIYPKLLKEMVSEGLIAEDGFVVRLINGKKCECPLYVITEEGKIL